VVESRRTSGVDAGPGASAAGGADGWELIWPISTPGVLRVFSSRDFSGRADVVGCGRMILGVGDEGAES
jgi:hypothetical protein